jgi:hypothetical protein
MLVEAQIQAIKTSAEKAANGDRTAQDFFKALRAGDQPFQREMLEYAEEYMKEKNIIFSEPLVDINLLPVQIESARKTLAKLKANPGDPAVSGFWAALEQNAKNKDPVALEYMKARVQILAAMDKEEATPKPDWFTGPEAKTSPETPAAVRNVPATIPAPVMGQPEAAQHPGQQVPQTQAMSNELQMVKVYRDEILVMRNEIMQARDAILGAVIAAPAPVKTSPNGVTEKQE